MPLLLVFGVGALAGGGTVFAAGNTAKNITTLAIVGGVVYYMYKKA